MKPLVLQFTMFSAQTCAWLLFYFYFYGEVYFRTGCTSINIIWLYFIFFTLWTNSLLVLSFKKKSNIYLTLISKIELKKLRKGLNLFHHQTYLRMFSYLWQIHSEHNKKRKEKKSIRCVLIILIFFREVIRCIHETRVRHYFLYRESQYNLKFMIF